MRERYGGSLTSIVSVLPDKTRHLLSETSEERGGLTIFEETLINVTLITVGAGYVTVVTFPLGRGLDLVHM